jgi:hypothetical protein
MKTIHVLENGIRVIITDQSDKKNVTNFNKTLKKIEKEADDERKNQSIKETA